MEIVMSKYKDFYEPISIMESKIFFFRGTDDGFKCPVKSFGFCVEVGWRKAFVHHIMLG